MNEQPSILLMPTTPNYMLTFNKEGKQVGSFDFNEGKMHFEGDLSDSGQIFVDWVLDAFKRRVDEVAKAERNKTLDEIAKKIGEMPFGDTAASFAVWIREQKT
jgi:hypothetical protein